jgi:hypothetical protein
LFQPEGVFITIFILIGQNRMSRQSDRRAHLDLQVSYSRPTGDDDAAANAAVKYASIFGVDTAVIEDEAEQLMSVNRCPHLVGRRMKSCA